jgi:hypothetical protein
MVRSIMYLTKKIPKVGLISKFMETPKEAHLESRKRIFSYVNGTKSHGIFYIAVDNFELVWYSDNDWGKNIDD